MLKNVLNFIIRVLLTVATLFSRRDSSHSPELSIWDGDEWESERQFQKEAEEAMWLHYLEEQATFQAEISISDDTWGEHYRLYHTGE